MYIVSLIWIVGLLNPFRKFRFSKREGPRFPYLKIFDGRTYNLAEICVFIVTALAIEENWLEIFQPDTRARKALKRNFWLVATVLIIASRQY